MEEKHLSPIDNKPSGRINDLKGTTLKAWLPIILMFLGSFTSIKYLHPLNALSIISKTLSGISIFFIFVYAKASLLIKYK